MSKRIQGFYEFFEVFPTTGQILAGGALESLGSLTTT